MRNAECGVRNYGGFSPFRSKIYINIFDYLYSIIYYI